MNKNESTPSLMLSKELDRMEGVKELGATNTWDGMDEYGEDGNGEGGEKYEDKVLEIDEKTLQTLCKR